MKITATNHWVWVKRDEVKKESGALLLPTSGRIKPHTGKILGVGVLAKDPNIKVGKTAVWHSSTGQELTFEDETFVVLADEHIIRVI